MYGTHVGTGAAGTAGLVGMQLGSQVMLALAVVLLMGTVVSVARRARRTGAHQRP